MNRSPASGASRLSRRAALRGAGATRLALTVSASGQTAGATQNATPLSGQPLPDAIAAVMNQPRYAEYTQWGIYAADRKTGEVVYDLNSVQRYVPGSTTKLFRPRQRSPPMDRTSVSRHRSIAGATSWTGRSMVI